jgi:hypothetical protein
MAIVLCLPARSLLERTANRRRLRRALSSLRSIIRACIYQWRGATSHPPPKARAEIVSRTVFRCFMPSDCAFAEHRSAGCRSATTGDEHEPHAHPPNSLPCQRAVLAPQMTRSDEAGLTTKPSKYSVRETIDRFETAVTAKGWMISTELDYAAAAARYGLELRPRTVIAFGNPKIGTEQMRKAPTWAIEVPPKAPVWQDD